MVADKSLCQSSFRLFYIMFYIYLADALIQSHLR